MALDGGNIALCVIISLQFAIAAGLVIYLLLRPKPKQHERDPRTEPADEVYTTYGDREPEGGNGHVAITIKEEDDDEDVPDKKSLSSSISSSGTPRKLDIDDVQITIEEDTTQMKAPEPDVASIKEDEDDGVKVTETKTESPPSSSSSSDNEDVPDEETEIKEEENKPDEVEFILTKKDEDTPTPADEQEEKEEDKPAEEKIIPADENAPEDEKPETTTPTPEIMKTTAFVVLKTQEEEKKDTAVDRTEVVVVETQETDVKKEVTTVIVNFRGTDTEKEHKEEDKDKVPELPTDKQSSSSSSSSSEDEKDEEVKTTISADFHNEKRKKFRSITTFQSGWKKRVTLEDLYQAKIITTEQTESLERGEITQEEFGKTIEKYLVGLQPIAGLLMAETGEKVTLYDAWKRGFLRRGTAISLLEAQAATGRILNPINGDKMSVAEASQVKLIDRQFQAVLVRAERAVTGYKTRRHPEPLSLFEAMQQGLVIENHGIRLLEAQIATGGIIDPKANHRLDVELAFERNLFDKRLHAILEDPSDDTRGFFDPNTEENLTYLELMHRCVIDRDTGFRLLPFVPPIKEVVKSEAKTVLFQTSTRREVTLQHIIDSCLLEMKVIKKIQDGTLSREEYTVIIDRLKRKVEGKLPIAGIINSMTGRKLSIVVASKKGIIHKGTAYELLEAQAACGKIVDVQIGKCISVETALKTGIIDEEHYDVVNRAYRAVIGYKEPFMREALSLCEALARHLVVEKHAIRLLEAQIATGGIIDFHNPARFDIDTAIEKGMLDSRLGQKLKDKETRSYFDPMTGENLNYFHLMQKCVFDKDSGLSYLMVLGGTVTENIVPFEPSIESKRIRKKNANNVTLPVVQAKKWKLQAPENAEISTSSKSSISEESSSTLHRKVLIMDPETGKEYEIDEALERELITEEMATSLKRSEGQVEDTQEDKQDASETADIKLKMGHMMSPPPVDHQEMEVIEEKEATETVHESKTATQATEEEVIVKKTSSRKVKITELPMETTTSTVTEVTSSMPTVVKETASSTSDETVVESSEEMVTTRVHREDTFTSTSYVVEEKTTISSTSSTQNSLGTITIEEKTTIKET